MQAVSIPALRLVLLKTYRTGCSIMIVVQEVAGTCSLQNKSGEFDLKLEFVSGPKRYFAGDSVDQLEHFYIKT